MTLHPGRMMESSQRQPSMVGAAAIISAAAAAGRVVCISPHAESAVEEVTRDGANVAIINQKVRRILQSAVLYAARSYSMRQTSTETQRTIFDRTTQTRQQHCRKTLGNQILLSQSSTLPSSATSAIRSKKKERERSLRVRKSANCVSRRTLLPPIPTAFQ